MATLEELTDRTAKALQKIHDRLDCLEVTELEKIDLRLVAVETRTVTGLEFVGGRLDQQARNAEARSKEFRELLQRFEVLAVEVDVLRKIISGKLGIDAGLDA